MKFTFEYPSDVPTAAPGFVTPDVLTRLSVQAEECGFDAIALSDHPAPSVKWRSSGGHDTVDPAVALSYAAAGTTTIRLMTHLYVLPFRNPYLAAKTLTTLDLLSGGRLIAAVGAGYLRSEFSALGADFGNRAALFDERLDALVKIWSDPQKPLTGTDFAATGALWLQPPLQRPHPPIWIGGNSKAARRRVVRYGQGWCPFLAPQSVAAAVRTDTISTGEEFGATVADLRTDLVNAGRDPHGVDIQIEVHAIDFSDDDAVKLAVQDLEDLRSRGATSAIVHVDASSVDAAADYLTAFTDTVIARYR